MAKKAKKKVAKKATKKAKKQTPKKEEEYRGSDITFCTTMSRLNRAPLGWNPRESW